MIIYDLQCAHEHRFEGWFEDKQQYETQQQNGQISCPLCGDTSVSRIPSAFAIKAAHKKEAAAIDPAELTRRVADFVEKNFDDVGSNFTREALKMHYGVIEPRNIRGVSTDQEEKLLEKEGVEYYKVPLPAPQKTDS